MFFELITYQARLVSGIHRALEHTELRWVNVNNLTELKCAPADVPTVEKLV